MPKKFLECKNAGGKIRTINLKKGVYLHICIDKDGKTHPGEVKHTKK